MKRLHKCFELLEAELEETKCYGIRGIIAEKESFSGEDPSQDLIDVFNVEAAIKAETYEICEYESLIDMARAMKHTQIAQLLAANLKEERATLKKMKEFAKTVKPQRMLSEGKESRNTSPSKRKVA